MNIGEQMLISGGEVHRVEDSIKRIFNAYGTERTDVFIITSSMVVTVHTADGKIYTQTRRITQTSADYEKLHKLNDLSRSICKNRFSSDEIQRQLDIISKCRTYPLWVEFFCYALIAGVFTLFFGGNITEAAVSFITGAVLRLVILVCDKTVKNIIFTKYVSAFISTALTFAALKSGIIRTGDKVIIGNIMTLIPGTGLTTALKDLLVGDSIAGLFRTLEACIAALSIAAGYFTFTFLAGGTV